jgi:rhodanese-related sulfurtransferase
MPDMIQREEVQRLLNSGGCLVEVLPEKEFKKVHLPRAINIPLQSLDRKTTTRLQKEQPVIVYCYDFQ